MEKNFYTSLGPLVRKIKDNQVEIIVNQLCTNMFNDDERLRDISSVGLLMNKLCHFCHIYYRIEDCNNSVTSCTTKYSQ